MIFKMNLDLYYDSRSIESTAIASVHLAVTGVLNFTTLIYRIKFEVVRAIVFSFYRAISAQNVSGQLILSL